MKSGLFRACVGARQLAGVVVLSTCLGGCAALLPQTTALRDQRPADLPDRVELADIPFTPQDDYQCGPAALAMALTNARVDVPMNKLVSEVYLPAREGSLQADMLATPRRHGTVSYRLAPSLVDVLREVAAGTPVVVLQNYGAWPIDVWHYALVVGYDYPAGEAILHSGEKAGMRMPFGVFEYLWRASDHWAMVVTPPQRLPASASEAGYLEAVGNVERVDSATAARAYRTLLERWPHNEGAAIGLANSHHARGELAAAEAVLRPALARHPDSPVLLNNLSQTLSDLGRHDEALSLVERAAAGAGPFAQAVAETRTLIRQRRNAQAPAAGAVTESR